MISYLKNSIIQNCLYIVMLNLPEEKSHGVYTTSV